MYKLMNKRECNMRLVIVSLGVFWINAGLCYG